MARRLRFIPANSLVEATCRTIQGRHLLRPGSRLNAIIVGILARAQARYGVKVCDLAFLSNHYHLLLVPENALQLAFFMNYLNSNLAREAGRLADWRARFWEKRFTPIPVSDEEVAQVDRLRYILAQGCKEGLVASPRDWPGVSSVQSRLHNTPLRGIWIDRSAFYESRRRRGRSRVEDFTTTEILELTPLPCWAHLDAHTLRDLYAGLVREIERAAAAIDRVAGRSLARLRRVKARDPHYRPAHVKTGPAPWIHAASSAARRSFREAYATFARAYRSAASLFRAGHFGVLFPEGSFPPSRRFVPLATS